MRIPWWIKLPAKLVLARVPLPYRSWRRLSLFRLGEMDNPEYALDVFARHFNRSGLDKRHGFTALELGPGDSAASAVVAAAHGASRTYLVDIGPFATDNVAFYRRVAEALEAKGVTPPGLGGSATFEGVLEACGASYLTRGLDSLRSIEDAGIDFIWSHAVLEHVARSEFTATVKELTRVLRPDGLMSHRIDFQDHFEESLNHLRFPNRLWESALFADSGFYTNRLRIGEVLEAFYVAGLAVDVVATDMWASIPISRASLDRSFRQMPVGELLVRGADIIARHR